MDFLTPYTRHSELQAIAVLSLIYTHFIIKPLHTNYGSQSVTHSTSRFLVTHFITGTRTVSLNYGLQNHCIIAQINISVHSIISFLLLLLNHLLLPSQETPLVLFLPVLKPRYVALGRPQQKTPFPTIPLL